MVGNSNIMITHTVWLVSLALVIVAAGDAEEVDKSKKSRKVDVSNGKKQVCFIVIASSIPLFDLKPE